jgi:mannose-6-phosphate isomerase-like protein (cupin superfamily)
MTDISPASGAIVRFHELAFNARDGYSISRAVGPEIGSEFVCLDVLRVSAGRTWSVADSADELVVVVFSGAGLGSVDAASQRIARASTIHCPTGSSLTIQADVAVADEPSDLLAYVWSSTLLPGRPTSAKPRLFGQLWDDETQLRNFGGTGQISPTDRLATMNFIHWPGTGSAQLCLHCGIQQPGETFSVHLHPASEDAFIAFEGDGQMYLQDRWVDVTEGDVLFARPGVLHGGRHPGGGTKRFVTCGGPTPFDPFLYNAAGVTAEVA